MLLSTLEKKPKNISKILRCEICRKKLTGDKKTNCGDKDCISSMGRMRYKIRKRNALLKRPCPSCGKIIPNIDDRYCSDICIINSEGIHETEEKFIRKNMYNIVVLANMAKLLPENRKRLNCIQERLERKYKRKYRFSLPSSIMLREFGFDDDVEIMSAELYREGILSGSSYEEVAYDISIYRKLFDYGIITGLIE